MTQQNGHGCEARRAGRQTSAQPRSGFPVDLAGVGALHAAFLNESRTRGCWWRPVQEIRRRAGRRIQGCRAPEVRHYLHPQVPRLQRSQSWRSVSQPFRAGLTFSSRPYGPGSSLRFISSSHAGAAVRPIRDAGSSVYSAVLARTAFSTRLSFLVRRQFTRGRKSAVSMRSR
jgi:hypothetical protein